MTELVELIQHLKEHGVTYVEIRSLSNVFLVVSSDQYDSSGRFGSESHEGLGKRCSFQL